MHAIRYVVFAIMFTLCSQNIFAAAASGHAREEILPKLRLSSEYLIRKPLPVGPLVRLYRGYASELTCAQVGVQTGDMHIQTEDRKTYVIELTPVTTWDSLQEDIEEKTGIPADLQKIMIGGQAAANLHDMMNWWQEGIVHVLVRR